MVRGPGIAAETRAVSSWLAPPPDIRGHAPRQIGPCGTTREITAVQCVGGAFRPRLVGPGRPEAECFPD
ncbi:hypothetical protein NDU88_005721 [Pleurodeles waltl]|uniref:Uncharacterized protein n=1 Tax=Pleurodeles waltl TaxID=8319 RepID=A0AAV7PNI3_PLEWA|nr:hypothetical protein NDU88_005721 [Pleurodeles waltl]